MLLIADPEYGRLKEPLQDWAERIGPLSPGSLLPLWWPEQAEGQCLTQEERVAFFNWEIEVWVGPSWKSAVGDTASPNEVRLMQRRVLQSLLQLLYGALGETPTNLD